MQPSAWLLENFSLPNEFQKDQRYRRIAGIARHAAEKAKIALSSAETAVIFASDEEVRGADAMETKFISPSKFREIISTN